MNAVIRKYCNGQHWAASYKGLSLFDTSADAWAKRGQRRSWGDYGSWTGQQHPSSDTCFCLIRILSYVLNPSSALRHNLLVSAALRLLDRPLNDCMLKTLVRDHTASTGI